MNNTDLIEKLIDSILSLKKVILFTQDHIGKVEDITEDTRQDILFRMKGYSDSVDKQLSLIGELEQKFAAGDSEGIGNIAKRINALSLFIRNDAREIIARQKGEKIETNKH